MAQVSLGLGFRVGGLEPKFRVQGFNSNCFRSCGLRLWGELGNERDDRKKKATMPFRVQGLVSNGGMAAYTMAPM